MMPRLDALEAMVADLKRQMQDQEQQITVLVNSVGINMGGDHDYQSPPAAPTAAAAPSAKKDNAKRSRSPSPAPESSRRSSPSPPPRRQRSPSRSPVRRVRPRNRTPPPLPLRNGRGDDLPGVHLTFLDDKESRWNRDEAERFGSAYGSVARVYIPRADEQRWLQIMFNSVADRDACLAEADSIREIQHVRVTEKRPHPSGPRR